MRLHGQLKPRLTYANVVSTICLFLLLGGGAAFAAGKLGKNTVGPKQLRKNSVTGAKIKSNAVTGAKVKDQSLTGHDINLGTLGTVPTAQQANSLSALESVHVVGAPGEPQFENGSTSRGTEGEITLDPVGFYKDHEGIVHLEGFANVDSGPGFVSVFTLPPGYRPAQQDGSRLFEQRNELVTIIDGNGRVLAREKVVGALEGITFRAGS